MEQLYYAPEIAVRPFLPEEETRHCIRVMRLGEGDEICVTDGKGRLYKAIIVSAAGKECSLKITESVQQQPCADYSVHIAVAPTKNTDRMEWFTEKATETGIDIISFLRCRYSERRDIKLNRIEKIAVGAMKQSQKYYLPIINEMIDFKDFILRSHDYSGCRMIAHCEEDGDRTLLEKAYITGSNALILIGPEGDFSHEEIVFARQNGFTPVSLGKSRLRTETAALIACHSIHLLNRILL